MSEGPRDEARPRWSGRVSTLAAASGPVFSPFRCGGGGAAGWGSGGILKGEQWGEGWAVAPDLSKRVEPGRGQGFLLGLAFSA